ncbi:ImmA/IrrE family metallo-endopeptidase [Romboutsia sp. Marseille-P6047]|uniref:ImmA/IrrE family metallo-endopeptidase n=1 Tax=Romboutsia sp. Marseille-P6047 TaxID=2161817 RepID=UPI000F04F616|nr:ImmA/IrrE family metallo-endopeptidase [Romboutsia sp. Marseille-P6047]
MDYRTRNIINKLADEIIESYKITAPIDDLESFVESIGGKVTENNLKSGFYDGRITTQNTDYEFEIFIPENQYLERKKFTIAHELGHLFLHMGYQIDDDLWEEQRGRDYYRNGSSEEELQANEFAAALLMPRDEYKKIMEKYTDGVSVNTAEIARYFGVSIQAAANRGKWLGYLAW